MVCGCATGGNFISQAISAGNIRPLKEKLDNQTEEERVETVRLMITNGHPLLFDLIGEEMKDFTEEDQVKLLTTVAVQENKELLKFLLTLDRVLYDDAVIDALYQYDNTIDPSNEIVKVFWLNMNQGERDSIDIGLKSRYNYY